MKKTFLLFIIFFAGIQTISAKISIGNADKIKVVHEFPNTEEYMTNPGRWIDLGIMYKAFTLAGAPFWITKDPVFVGVENNNTDFYLELSAAESEALIAEHHLNKAELLKLSFWDKHGGFVYLAIAIILIFLYTKFFGAKDEDEIEVVQEEKKLDSSLSD